MKYQWTKIIRREERENEILQKKTRGEKSSEGVTLNFKWDDNEQKKKRKIKSMNTV